MASSFFYDNLELEIIQTNCIERTNVLSEDGADVRFVRWRFDISAIYNPQATSFTALGTAGAGNLPPVTDQGIRDRLMAKRKRLQYICAGTTVLESPKSGRSVDASTGPNPISCTVTRVIGAKTWMVQYQIETWVVPCSGIIPAMLSHRWSMRHQVDDRRLCTRTIQGRVHFAKDELLNLNLDPDDFRSEFLHPVPDNFNREHVDVLATPDGAGAQYTVIDQEKMMSLGKNAPAVKVEGYYSVSTENGCVHTEHVVARAWGERSTDHKMLIGYVFQVVGGKISFAPPTVVKKAVITTAMHEKFVELQVSVLSPTPSTDNKLSIPYPSERLHKFGTVYNTVLDEKTNIDNPPPQNSNASRGLYLGKAIAAALQSPCDVKTRPTNPPLSR